MLKLLNPFLYAVVCAALLGVSAIGNAQEWPRFRGPNGTGIGLAKGIPSKFTMADAAWRVALKSRGPLVAGVVGRPCVHHRPRCGEGGVVVQCLKAGDGSEAWSIARPHRRHRIHKFNHLASSTPATDGKRLVVMVSEPGAHTVLALGMNGKKLWEKKFETVVSNHGGGASPIFHSDKIIVQSDEDGRSFLAALDAGTGRQLWRQQRASSKASFATPCHSSGPPARADCCSTAWPAASRL